MYMRAHKCNYKCTSHVYMYMYTVDEKILVCCNLNSVYSILYMHIQVKEKLNTYTHVCDIPEVPEQEMSNPLVLPRPLQKEAAQRTVQVALIFKSLTEL